MGDYFVFFMMRRAVAQLRQRTHGAVFDTITRGTFDGVKVVKPPPALLLAFEDAVAPLMVMIRENVTKSASLASVRDALLPRLLTGSLRVTSGADDG